MRTLCVVSGGDAPGINTLLAHYTANANEHGDAVLGASGGFPGLLEGRLGPLDFDTLIPWIGRAGCVLQSSRDPVLKDHSSQAQIKKVLAEHQIDNILLFGGNGTLRYIPPLLQEWNISCVSIPTTIDNDVPGTDLSLGFDSACNYAIQTIDGILATAHALRGRIFMVETLGGNCGHIALAVAESSCAHVVILPEYEYTDEWLQNRLLHAIERFGYALIVIGEGARGARTLADEIPQWIGYRMRDVRLGHAQRGAIPSHRDRQLAAKMAHCAAQSLRSGTTAGTVVVRQGSIVITAEPLPEESVLPDKAVYNMINGFNDEPTGS